MTHNELMAGLNSSEHFALVIVEVEDGRPQKPRYVWNPPFMQPDSTVVSINLNMQEYLAMSKPE